MTAPEGMMNRTTWKEKVDKPVYGLLLLLIGVVYVTEMAYQVYLSEKIHEATGTPFWSAFLELMKY